MNLNLNIAAATMQAGETRVAAGKSRALPSASQSPSPAASNSETLEISGRQAQALDDSQGAMQPIIADEAAANDTLDFIKNAIIALPALVLRSQANLAQHSAGALLQ